MKEYFQRFRRPSLDQAVAVNALLYTKLFHILFLFPRNSRNHVALRKRSLYHL